MIKVHPLWAHLIHYWEPAGDPVGNPTVLFSPCEDVVKKGSILNHEKILKLQGKNLLCSVSRIQSPDGRKLWLRSFLPLHPLHPLAAATNFFVSHHHHVGNFSRRAQDRQTDLRNQSFDWPFQFLMFLNTKMTTLMLTPLPKAFFYELVVFHLWSYFRVDAKSRRRRLPGGLSSGHPCPSPY